MAELKESLVELMMAFVILLVGLYLTSPIATSIASAVTALTSYTAAAALVPVIAIMWVIMLVMIPVVVIYKMIKDF